MKIKFFLAPYQSPSKSNYQHLSVALAEGLKALNIPFSGNIDYWYQVDEREYLIRKDEDTVNSDIHIYSISYFRNATSEEQIDASKINVMLDASDGVFTESQDPRYKNFDLILRTHYNEYITYPSNVKPWAFGLTNRMIKACNDSLISEKSIQILQNFRVEHQLRGYLTSRLTPRLESHFKVDQILTAAPTNADDASYWAQTGKRHIEEYFWLLNRSIFNYAFGGTFLPRSIEPHYQRSLYRKSFKMRSKIVRRMTYKYRKWICIGQFDSWRFWESLCSSTIPIHIDLKSYGCMLPVMPSNWYHYVGIEDINKIDNFVSRLIDLDSEDISNIASQGRSWVLEHYSPVATATRFLDLLSADEM